MAQQISMTTTPGLKFRQAITDETPLQIVGTINAFSARQAELAGFRAIYLSGAGVANASWAMPDLGMTSMSDVAEDARRIVSATQLPLLVDIDTGWGHALCIARTIKTLSAIGVAAVHIEDQQAAKRCGHRPNKSLVSTDEMVDRIHAAVDARKDDSFVIMARTDALAGEGVEAAIERCSRYVEAGADMIFAEAITEPDQYRKIYRYRCRPRPFQYDRIRQEPAHDRGGIKGLRRCYGALPVIGVSSNECRGRSRVFFD